VSFYYYSIVFLHRDASITKQNKNKKKKKYKKTRMKPNRKQKRGHNASTLINSLIQFYFITSPQTTFTSAVFSPEKPPTFSSSP